MLLNAATIPRNVLLVTIRCHKASLSAAGMQVQSARIGVHLYTQVITFLILTDNPFGGFVVVPLSNVQHKIVVHQAGVQKLLPRQPPDKANS
jgi:hypothetical protein